MARPIGAGATGVPIDYSSWADSAWRLGAANAGAFNSVANEVTGILEDRKVKKDQIKVSADLLKAYATINPERADTFNQIAEQLKDEERPLSERAAFAEQVGSLVSMDQDRQKSDRQIAQFAQNYALDAQRANLDQGRFNNENAVFQANFADGQEDRAANKEAEVAIGNATLSNALEIAKQMEAAGQQPPISSSQLQQTLQAGSPIARVRTAEAFNSLLPRAKEPKIHTIDATDTNGNPISLPVTFNYDTGKFDPIKIGGPPSGIGNYSAESGVFRAPTTHYSQGSAVGGPDEMQDKWTNKGYSSTGKNLAPGVVAVNEEAYKLGTVFQDADTGETFIAADRHGNKNPSVIDIYQPPGEYTKSSKPRNLRVIGFEENIGKSPQEIASQRAKWAEVASQYITPGAVKAGAKPKTEAELKKEQLEIQKLEGDLAGQKATQATEAQKLEAAKVKTNRLLDTIDQYTYRDATGKLTYNKRLDDAVGFGGGVGKQINRVIDGRTLADQQALERFVEQDLLEATKDLKPVSEDEMKLLMSRRPKIGDKPEAWAAYMDEIRRFVIEKTGESAPAPQSASDRLRSRINAQ